MNNVLVKLIKIDAPHRVGVAFVPEHKHMVNSDSNFTSVTLVPRGILQLLTIRAWVGPHSNQGLYWDRNTGRTLIE